MWPRSGVAWVFGVITAVTSSVDAFCWNNQRDSILPNSGFNYYLECESGCAVTRFVGNYSSQGLNGNDFYEIRYGHQYCSDVSSFRYIADFHSDGSIYRKSFSGTCIFTSCQPRILVFCANTFQTCQIEGSYCLDAVFGLQDGKEVELDLHQIKAYKDIMKVEEEEEHHDPAELESSRLTSE